MTAPNEREPTRVREKDINARIGETIRLLRLERRVQQKDIAAHLGITPEQFQHMERGTSFVSAARLLLLCQFIGISMGDFQSRLRRKLGMRNELFRNNAYARLSDGLVADFLAIPNESTRQLIRALVHDCRTAHPISVMPDKNEGAGNE